MNNKIGSPRSHDHEQQQQYDDSLVRESLGEGRSYSVCEGVTSEPDVVFVGYHHANLAGVSLVIFLL